MQVQDNINPNKKVDIEAMTVVESTGSANEWFVSYSDIVTLLLCFFMMFYAMEKSRPKKLESQIIADLKEGLPGATGVQGAKGDGTGIGKGTNLAQKGVPLSDLKNIVSPTEAVITETPDFIKIDFQNKTFFPLGSTKLTEEGRGALQYINEKLSPYKGKIRLTVVGHTDSMPVQQKKYWWRDNMELSVARALSVRREVLKMGTIPPEEIVVSGEADYTPPVKDEKLYESGSPFGRRVSIKIEAI